MRVEIGLYIGVKKSRRIGDECYDMGKPICLFHKYTLYYKSLNYNRNFRTILSKMNTSGL